MTRIARPHFAARLRWLPALFIVASLALGALSAQAGSKAKVQPPTAKSYGKKYPEWSAAWWQWALTRPVTGHPFIDDPAFDVTAGQTGDVWFLGSPFGPVQRTCTIPAGKALFIGMINGEASDLEGLGTTAQEQEAFAIWQADHFYDVACEVDGVPVSKIEKYRVVSPQFAFNAPNPWIFGSEGGLGTAVADGYYVMIAPLTIGQHTLHYGGTIRFSVADGDPFDFEAVVDTTYILNVQ